MLMHESRKPKIMVVDDQEIVRYTLDVVLENQGYQVFQASGVLEAISVLAQNRPDLVLLDLTMPDIEGIVLLRQMRKSPLFKSTPVIILTAHSDRNFVAEALALGARDYVLKLGFLVDDLLARIRVRLEEAGVLVPVRTKAPTPLEINKPLRAHLDLGEFLEQFEGRALPASKAGILQSCTSSLSSLDSMEALLRNDPILAARMMSKARGLLSRKRPLGRIGEALQILGETHQREVLESARAYESQETVPEDLLRAWTHALFCSRWLERFCPEMTGATLVGLCHDLPEILLMQHMSEEGWTSLREVARGRGKILTHMVEELFGIPYGEYAGAVFQRLGLPEEITRPVMEHTNAFLSSSPIPATRDALRIEAANQWAHAYMLISTRNVPIRLPVKGEVEPQVRSEDRAEIALLCDQSWGSASHAFQGLALPPEAYRMAAPVARPRFVLVQEPWIVPQSSLEHLLCEYGHLVTEPIEELAADAWDLCIYLGDNPQKAFPNGFGTKPLLVLHRLSRDSCQFPQSPRMEALRMPASISQLERVLANLT
jgi:DNA-binding response OmpR family regulator